MGLKNTKPQYIFQHSIEHIWAWGVRYFIYPAILDFFLSTFQRNNISLVWHYYTGLPQLKQRYAGEGVNFEFNKPQQPEMGQNRYFVWHKNIIPLCNRHYRQFACRTQACNKKTCYRTLSHWDLSIWKNPAPLPRRN